MTLAARKQKAPSGWEEAFLRALRQIGIQAQAAAAVDVTMGAVHYKRKTNPRFDARCRQLLDRDRAQAREGTPGRPRRALAEQPLELAALVESPPAPPRTRVRGFVIWPLHREIDLVVDASASEALQLVEASILAEAAEQALPPGARVGWSRPPKTEMVIGDD